MINANELETCLAAVMTQIVEAASKKDLAAIQRLSRKATELQELKDQAAALQKRITSVTSADPPITAAILNTSSNGEARKLPIEVTAGDINQNLLKLTPHIKRGKIKIGEELIIEALPSGKQFHTKVSEKGNKLQARGKIAQFYKDAEVQPDDFVLLTEESPGHWTLKKAPLGAYSRYP